MINDECFIVEYYHISSHMIFKANIDLTKKERFVSDKHKTPNLIKFINSDLISTEMIYISISYNFFVLIDIWKKYKNIYVFSITIEE